MALLVTLRPRPNSNIPRLNLQTGIITPEWALYEEDLDRALRGATITVPVTPPSAAAQADQETATSLTTFVSPGRQQSHPSSPKAWCRFDGTTGTIATSYNVTSVTRNSVGDYTVAFTTNFSAATWMPWFYSTPSIGATNFGPRNQAITSMAVGSIRFETLDGLGTNEDQTVVCFAAFGDQ